MKGLLLGLLFATSNSPTDLSVASRAIEWKLNGELASNCILATWGSIQTSAGVQLNVQCDSEEAVAGNLALKLPASQYQNRRVTLVMDVEQGQQMSSTLWVRSSRDNHTQSFESDADDALLDSNPVGSQRSITAVIANADAISVGLMLRGSGAVTLKHVRLIVAPNGEISSQAQDVLDKALSAIQEHAARSEVRWMQLQLQANQLAAGAQDSAEVYPVIRYVLQQLGDRRSMVLSPAIARSLEQRKSAPSAAVKIFALPDGAELVLAATTNSDRVSDSRVANNLP